MHACRQHLASGNHVSGMARGNRLTSGSCWRQVYESEGLLEGVPDAVRRGRKLKCKECGSKGATLGCHVRNCRSSFHLPCARLNHCVLQVGLPNPNSACNLIST